MKRGSSRDNDRLAKLEYGRLVLPKGMTMTFGEFKPEFLKELRTVRKDKRFRLR